MSTTNAQFVHQMYITYLQRPAEPAGHAFWVSELESGVVTREELAAQFGGSDEFTGRFTEADRAELINEVYQALFGRDAEEEGLAFWMSEETDIALLPTVIAEASADWDGATLQNRLTFAEKLMDSLSQEQYESVTQEQLREMLSNVTDATEVTDEFVADVVADVEQGDTLALTEALALIAEGGELPEGYSLTDTTLVLGAATIAATAEQIAAAQTVVDGAANAEELELAAEYSIEDSAENVLAAVAAENPLVADISLITLTDENITAAQRDALVEAGFDEDSLPALAPLTLTEALAALQDAQADKADFLKEAAEIDFVKTTPGATTEAKIGAAVTGADGVVALIQYDTDGNGIVDTFVYGTGDSDGVKAAKVADAQAQLAENLTDAQEALADAQADVAKISGLASAIDLYNARVEAQKATEKTLDASKVTEAGAVAAYNAYSTNTSITPDSTTGVAIGVIVPNATTGRLELASGVTETTNPGVGAVLTAVQARVDATAANAAALDAIEAAVIAIGYLDFTTGDKDAIAVAIDSTKTTFGDGDKLTQAQIQVELNELLAAAQDQLLTGKELTFNGVGEISNVSADFADDATGSPTQDAFNALKFAVNTFESFLTTKTRGEYDFTNTVETKVQIAAQDDVATAEKAIVDLDKALSDLTAAKELAAELKAFDDAITAAGDAFEDLGVEVPVTIDGTVIGTAENDVFLASDKAGTIVNFNAQGEDSIFFGTDFADLVILGSTEAITSRVGDAAALEIFAKQNGSNVDLYVEQETFAGNGTTEADIVKITLSGVSGISVDELVLADGFLTIA